MEEKWRWLAYWRNYQFTCTLTLKHLYLLCADTSCSVKVSSAQFALPLTPLFLLYLVLGDTSGIAVMCAKGLHLPIFSSVCVTSFVCCVSRGAVDLKELLNCNIRLIKQRNIVCKATFLHELSWIKLFRTDQGHSSQLHFAYFGHVFLLRPVTYSLRRMTEHQSTQTQRFNLVSRVYINKRRSAQTCRIPDVN